ncbi:MAG: YadA-like family protein, partial [Erythrobacter sp.]
AAVGRFAASAGNQGTSVGFQASAARNFSTAVGSNALADANDAVAVGSGASVTHTASTAIGANATSTTVNQVTLGGAGSSVRVGDIAASTDAQVGPVDVVTVDAAGTLGVQQAASAASVDNVRVSLNALSEVSEAQFTGLSNSVLALDGRVSGLEFQLQDVEERLTGGIAAAMALGGQMIVPDSTVSFSLNASTFQGEQGFAGSVSARLAEKVYISAGVAGSTASDSTGGRVGVAFGF